MTLVDTSVLSELPRPRLRASVVRWFGEPETIYISVVPSLDSLAVRGIDAGRSGLDRPSPMGQQRAHHYVPACLLVGFTREGTRRSPLHVFDRVKREWRPSTPDKSAKENDFYTVDRPSLDPLEAENALAKIEDAAAPVLREATVSGRLPSGDAEITLINFVAVQDARSPVTRVQEWAARQRFWLEQTRQAVAGGKVEFLRRQASDDVTLPDFDTFEEAQRALTRPELAFGDTTDSVSAVFELASSSMEKLNRLQWSLLVARADAPDFVCSDEPVLHFATSASRERGLGLGSGVIMPIGSRHALAGSARLQVPREKSVTKRIAGFINAHVALMTARHVYAEKAESHWLDEPKNRIRRSGDVDRHWRHSALAADFLQGFYGRHQRG